MCYLLIYVTGLLLVVSCVGFGFGAFDLLVGLVTVVFAFSWVVLIVFSLDLWLIVCYQLWGL